MPPRIFSRHLFTTGTKDASGRSYLDTRIPFGFKEFADNQRYVVQQGDTLQYLASQFFAPIDRPAGLWWIIADFQPNPIHDPTIELLPGSVLVIPSQRTVAEAIFSEKRREDSIL